MFLPLAAEERGLLHVGKQTKDTYINWHLLNVIQAGLLVRVNDFARPTWMSLTQPSCCWRGVVLYMVVGERRYSARRNLTKTAIMNKTKPFTKHCIHTLFQHIVIL